MSRGHDIGVDRRKLMQMMGAGGAIGFTAGCSTTEETETEEPGGDGDDGETEDTATPTPTPEPLKHGGTFIDGTLSDSRGVNPYRIGDGETSTRVSQLIDYGFEREGPGYNDITPKLFEEVDIADSLDVVEITLRDNLQFSDPWGELTADDYIWNIENVFLSDWYNYTYSYTFYSGDELIQTEKVDKYTIRQELPESRPFYPYNIQLSYTIPAPRDIVEPYAKEGDEEGLDQDDDIRFARFSGNLGAWDLKDYKSQSVAAFEAAEDYYLREVAEDDDRVPDEYADAPYFDEYHRQYFDEENTALQALRAREIDRESIPSTKLDSFQEEDNLFIYTNPYIAYSDYLGMNHRANGWEGFNSEEVRQAVSELYYNEFVVENLLEGRGSVQNTLHPGWGPYYPDQGLFEPEGDLEKAKDMLESGTSSDWGYSGDEFVGPDGEQLELKCVYVTGVDDDLRVEYTKSRFEEAGIAVDIQSTSWASLLQNYFYTNQPAEGVDDEEAIGYGSDGQSHPSIYNWGPADKAVSPKDWDLMHTLGFSYGPLDPAGTVAALFGEQETFNAYGYQPSQSIVDLREEAQSASSLEAAASTVQEMMELISKERPVAFESNYFSYNGYNDRTRGVPESPAANYFVDQNHDLMAFEDGDSGR